MKKEQEITEEIKEWVNSNDVGLSFREVTIKGHCHGVRVTIAETDNSDIATSVSDNVADAFHDCLKNYDAGKIYKAEKKIQDLRRWLKEQTKELSSLEERLKKEEETFKRCAGREAKPYEEIFERKGF